MIALAGSQWIRGLQYGALCTAFALLSACGGASEMPEPEADAPAPVQDLVVEAPREPRCFLLAEHALEDYSIEKCADFTGPNPDYLLIGDELAGDMLIGLRGAFKGADIGHFIAPGCPLPTTIDLDGDRGAHCLSYYRYAFGDLVSETSPDGVILAADWTRTADEALLSIVERLSSQGVETIVVGQRPIIGEDGRPTQETLSRRNEVVELLDGQAALLSVFDTLCPDNGCVTTDNAGDAIFDNDRKLSVRGSVWLGREIIADGGTPLDALILRESDSSDLVEDSGDAP